eukprot:NODE_225_length_12315_cov_1.300671.p8 type:complete len:181 gc:universal NODE_225_length_12315_cov_1.300671:9889-10431(+)
MNSSQTYFVFIDLEMTGLEVKHHKILEFAMIITNENLDILKEFHSPVHQSQNVIDNMTSWCKDHFLGPGNLAEECLNSKMTESKIEIEVVSILQKYPGTKYLAGNSISTDKYFLMEYMPAIIDCLHYRIIDVSTLKTLVNCWLPQVQQFPKALRHRALDDIKESIEELSHFRKLLFNKAN